MTCTDFFSLPSEIIWKILQLLEPIDLSHTRQVSKRLRTYCDHPINWTTISLVPPSNITEQKDILTLWNLTHLQTILQPHVSFIKTIQIYGVRDNIVRYLLENCQILQNLTISGWSTLSDHAFSKQPCAPLCLRTLRLIGQQKKTNFTSLDATTFGKLIANCPQLEEISVVSCQIHVQADTLLDSFGSINVCKGGDSLKSFIVATKRTWSSQHVAKLFQLCSNLRYLALVPGSTNTMDHPIEKLVDAPSMMPVMRNSQSVLQKNLQMIEEHEIMEFDNIVIYST